MLPTIATSSKTAGPDQVTLPFLLDTTVRAETLASAWREILSGREPTLAELVLIEYWFSVGAADLVKVIDWRWSYSKTLLTIRQRVAIALHDYAREINWRRPVLFVSVLKIARAYLRDAVGHEDALRRDYRKEFTGRLGVATVLISRFETVSADDAREALLILERSIDQGNTNDSAFSYLLEASCVSHDLEPDVDLLDRAIIRAETHISKSRQEPSVTLAHIDLLLRKATALGFTELDQDALLRAERLAEACSPNLAEDKVRLIMAQAILRYLRLHRDEGLGLAHARLPFGLRTDDAPNQLLVRSARYVIDPLRRMAANGEPLARGLLADYLLVAANLLGMSEEVALDEVVKLRGGDRSLGDERNRLLHCRDQLRLAAITNDKSRRIDALLGLAEMLDISPIPAAPLVILARDVRDYGAQPVPIEAGTTSYVEEILFDVSKGRADALYAKAGSAALASPDLSILALGGRSGVTSVADYYGLSSETFVFKTMTRVAVEQERNRANVLGTYLVKCGLQNRFNVSQVLATYTELRHSSEEVTAARHYIRGNSLYEVVRESVPDRQAALMTEAAAFLGAINYCERGLAPNEGRRDVKGKEFGRWLKACGLEDVNAVFDRWWEVMSKSALVRRRDAHLHNWLMGDNFTLYAIDLEAQGWRPAGYELAQITDDHAFLEADDWDTRRSIFDAYRSSRQAEPGTEDAEWLAYQAGVLSRLVWGLTGAADGPLASGAAEERLSAYMKSVTDDRLRKLASEILSGWLTQRGLTQLPTNNSAAQGAGRIRTSKSIAFHLRHDPSLERDEGGWALLEDLQQRLTPKLPIEVLAAVATDKNEQRFEISAGKIRAKYGHSIPIRVDYSKPKSPLRLYHASPWSLASAVVDSRGGIRPIERQFVHLTSSVREAVANGMRAGQPLLYSVSSLRVPSVLLAHGSTYLSNAIPMQDLSIVPVSCFWPQIPPCI